MGKIVPDETKIGRIAIVVGGKSTTRENRTIWNAFVQWF